MIRNTLTIIKDTTINILTALLRFLQIVINIITNTVKTILGFIYVKLTFSNLISLFYIISLVLIILIIVYNDKILNYLTNSGGSGPIGTQLILQQPTPIYIQKTYSLINPPTTTNFAFSFWIYINNSPTTNYEIPIFKYGSSSPYITMNNDLLNNMNFYPSEYFVLNKQPTPFSIFSQKWNYIVAQYNGNSFELYLNCNLINHLLFNNTNIPQFTINDNIIIGDTNLSSLGIGTISNINYYSTPLTLSQMNIYYNLGNNQ